jgi:hypothetical protein
MLKLLRFLLTGNAHDHKWDIHSVYACDIYENEKGRGLPAYTVRVYVLVCKKCGAVKFRKIKY